MSGSPVDTPWSKPTVNDTSWGKPAASSTLWQPQVNITLAGGFLLQQDGTSKLLLQDGITKLDQQ